MRRISFLSILALYFSSGLSLTLYNKFILSAAHYGFSYPVTLILVHMICNCLLSGLALRCVFHAQTRHSPFHPRNISRRVFLRQFVPIGLLFGADICLTNVSFRFVSVSLTEVVKSAVPALIFLLGLVRGQDRSRTWWLLGAKLLNVVLICLGVALTAAGEVDFEIRGFVAACGATLAAVFKLILIEVLLARVEQDVPPTGAEQIEEEAHARAHARAHAQHSGSSGGLHAAENGVHSKSHLSPSAAHSGDSNGRPTDDEPSFPRPRSASNTPHAATGGGGGGSINSSGGGSGRVFSSSASSSLASSKKQYARIGSADDDDDHHEQRRLTPTAVSSSSPRRVSIERVHVGSTSADHLHSSLPCTPTCDDSGAAAPDLAPHGSAVGPHAHRLHPILSLFYFTPVSALALLPLQLWLEFPSLTASKFVSAGVWEATVGLILFGALMAFGLNCSELFVISETSALTLCIFGVLKFLIIVALSWALFQQSFTATNQAGIAITVVALVVYNTVKWYELREREREMAMQAQSVLGDSPTFQRSHGGRATTGGKANGGGGKGGGESMQLHHATLMSLENGHGTTSSSPRAITHSALAATAAHNSLPASDNEGSSGSSSSSNSSVGSEDSLLPRSVGLSASSSHKPRASPAPASGSAALFDAEGCPLPQDIGSRLLHAFAAADRLDDPEDDPDEEEDALATIVAHVRPTSPSRAALQ